MVAAYQDRSNRGLHDGRLGRYSIVYSPSYKAYFGPHHADRVKSGVQMPFRQQKTYVVAESLVPSQDQRRYESICFA